MNSRGDFFNVLLIGVTGHMGTAIEHICHKEEITCLGVTSSKLDITDATAVEKFIASHDFNVVLNMAAVVGIDICELKPERCFAVNSIAVSNLANSCERHGIILVQPSTHAVFDGRKDGLYTERDKPNPLNIYGASKYAAECFASNLCHKHYVVRFPLLFGPTRYWAEGFLGKMIDRIRNHETLRVADDKFDTPTYTFDAAQAVLDLITKSMPYGLYHVANSGMASYYSLVSMLLSLMKADVPLLRAKDKDFPSQGIKPLRVGLKSVKLEPLRPWEEALEEYVTFYGLR